MGSFERNGWTLHYQEAGAGTPVLLIHGMLSDALLPPTIERTCS